MMAKTPVFEERKMFGASSENRPVAAPESIRITEGAVVDLRYEGKTVAIRVTKVIQPQAEFEGAVEAFDQHEIEHGDLKQGDVVRFSYQKIEHIHKWTESDET